MNQAHSSGGAAGQPTPPAKVFVEGRYRKLTRDLPQTVFWCPECKGHPRRRRNCARCEGFGKLTRDSVQELVGWVAGKAFQTRKHKFHGAGREDVDVRMLGEGRPFVLELVNPKVFDVDLAEVEAEINRRNEGRLEIRNLHWAEKARVRILKETHHAKTYEARLRVDGEIAQRDVDDVIGQRINIRQRTPGRVAHRRADLERERWIEVEALEPAPDHGDDIWSIRLRTQHGTYVKEVLSGDEGKTTPCLGDFLHVQCACVELDVLEILGAEGEEDPELAVPPPFGAGL